MGHSHPLLGQTSILLSMVAFYKKQGEVTAIQH
jgi:hypothetical protein